MGAKGTSDCADEVTLSRKGANSPTRARKLRSTGTKAKARASNRPNSLSELKKQLEARTRELAGHLSEALEQQIATSDVLKVISRSTFDLQTVLDTLVESATRLCNADHAWLFQREGEFFHWVTSFGHAAEVRARLRDYFKPLKVPVERGSITGRTALEGRVVHVPDVLADPDYTWTGAQEIGGYRAALGAPLLRKGDVVGVIFVAKTAPQPFTAKQIELVTTFADQAVIAIENARLLNELRVSLQQQSATADVLKTISRSTFDLQAVLDTLAESAARLCEADHVWLYRREGEIYRWAASYGHSKEEHERIKQYMLTLQVPPGRGSVVGRAALEGQPVQIADALTDPEYTYTEAQKIAGFRSLVGVALLREGVPIGAIALQRTEVRPFTDKQIELATTFADQAVIAIENVRLFDEVQARTREVQESLDYQTAISDVLNVISRSPNELQPVIDAILQTAARLCEAEHALFFKLQDGKYHLVGSNNVGAHYVEYLFEHPIRPGRGSLVGRTAVERKTVHLPDCLADPEYDMLESQQVGGYRTMLGVPLLSDGVVIAVISLQRNYVKPFTDRQIELITTFADQALIAIENVRLFDEVQARTEELSESLQQQTATADVLKVISRSTFDLKAVLQTLVESAGRLCGADYATITRQKDGVLFFAEAYGYSSEFIEYVKAMPVERGRGTATGRALLEGRVIHIADVLADPEYTWAEAQRLGGYRTVLAVPMLREGVPTGVLTLTRSEARPFTEKQVELVSTF